MPLTTVIIVFLMLTELPIFRNYFARNWPLFSLASGFVTLAFFMMVLGILILGNLNKSATSRESLGLSFWQVVISGGILTLFMGVVNLFAVSTFFTPSFNPSISLTH